MPGKDTTSVPDLLAEFRKSARIGVMADVVDPVVGLSTGNLAVDYLTGVGGLPVGRLTELYGQPSSGKSTTALQAAALLQRQIIDNGRDEFIVFFDFEKALDADYAAALGIDTEHESFIVSQPNWLEEGAEIGEKLIRTGKVRMSIWDSVAKMTPRDLEFGVRTNAMERARLMNSLLQRLTSLLYENRCAGVFLNHLVEAIPMGPTRPGMPPTETSPGGKALKFYASLRMAYKQIKTAKGAVFDPLSGETTQQATTTQVKVKVTKNKVGIPFREAEVRVHLGHGFDNAWTALQILTAYRHVTAAPAGMFYFDTAKTPRLVHPDMPVSSTGRAYLRGEAEVSRFAAEHIDWVHDFHRAAAAAIQVDDGAALDQLPADPTP